MNKATKAAGITAVGVVGLVGVGTFISGKQSSLRGAATGAEERRLETVGEGLSGDGWYEQVPNVACQVPLTLDECQAAAEEKGLAFETRDQLALVSGCMIQKLADEVLYNLAPDNRDWEGKCDQDNCLLRAFCKQEDWVTNYDGAPCARGFDMDNTTCYNVALDNFIFHETKQWEITNDPLLPNGCFGDKENKWISFNNNPNGNGDVDPSFYWPICSGAPSTPNPTPEPTPMPTPEPTPMPTKAPAYQTQYGYFVSHFSGKHGMKYCLDAKRRRERGGTVHMWPCVQFKENGKGWVNERVKREIEEQNKNQHWDFMQLAHFPGGEEVVLEEWGMLKNHDGICLDAGPNAAENGGQVYTWPCRKGNKNQMWKFDEKTGLVHNFHGKCLDARERSTVGGKVHMWTCNDLEKNQNWNPRDVQDMPYYWPVQDYTKNILDPEVRNWNGPHLVDYSKPEGCPEIAGEYYWATNEGPQAGRAMVYADGHDLVFNYAGNNDNVYGYIHDNCQGYMKAGNQAEFKYDHEDKKIYWANEAVWTQLHSRN